MSTIGTVGRIWRFPVKSMGGEVLREGCFSTHGLLGDRAYALIDKETGRVVSAKSVRRFPDLLHCQARFVEPPTLERPRPTVEIVLPSGTSVRSDAANIDSILSDFFRRDVSLAHAAPADYTIDQYHPAVAGADPSGLSDEVVEQRLGAAYFKGKGKASPVSDESFYDLYPVTVMTTSTLAALSAQRPDSVFDERRFRMNVIAETRAEGFVENDWVGSRLALGGEVGLEVVSVDPRCVMTSLAQGELPNDLGVLRAMVEHNSIELGKDSPYPCAGVYAVVHKAGILRVGDPISLG